MQDNEYILKRVNYIFYKIYLGFCRYMHIAMRKDAMLTVDLSVLASKIVEGWGRCTE